MCLKCLNNKNMAELMRMGGIVSIPKDRLGSPSSGSEDGGAAVDLAELAQELDQDEFDGPPLINGKKFNLNCVN